MALLSWGGQVWRPLPWLHLASPGEGCAGATSGGAARLRPLQELKHFCPFSASSGTALQPDGSRCQPVPWPRGAALRGFSSLAKPAWGRLGCSKTS